MHWARAHVNPIAALLTTLPHGMTPGAAGRSGRTALDDPRQPHPHPDSPWLQIYDGDPCDWADRLHRRRGTAKPGGRPDRSLRTGPAGKPTGKESRFPFPVHVTAYVM